MSIEPGGAPPSPLLGRPGAVAADGPDAGVAAHYGDPVREQRVLVAGDAVVDLSHRGVLAITGPDRLSWLDSLLSQRLTTLAPGGSAEALLLDPTGRVEHAMAVLEDGETTWLVVEQGERAALASFLERMRFLLRVEVADRTAAVAVLGGFGPQPSLDDLPTWSDPWETGAEGGATTAAVAEHPGTGWRFRLWLVPRAELDRRTATLRLAGVLALEALRIAAWRPRFATEVDARSIPNELDWTRSAVHLSKGCYRGQETVAKVFNLGRPPRRIVQLDLDGSDGVLPKAGDALRLDGVDVGAVTSVGLHHEDGPIALAVVKRSVPAAAVLEVAAEDGPIAAAQRVVLAPDLAPAVAVPRLPRLGAGRG